jgi:hypothetical protein
LPQPCDTKITDLSNPLGLIRNSNAETKDIYHREYRSKG